MFHWSGRRTNETVKMQCQTPARQNAGFPGTAVTAVLGVPTSQMSLTPYSYSTRALSVLTGSTELLAAGRRELLKPSLGRDGMM